MWGHEEIRLAREENPRGWAACGRAFGPLNPAGNGAGAGFWVETQ